jgi:hypothetical protein
VSRSSWRKTKAVRIAHLAVGFELSAPQCGFCENGHFAEL